ncbi:MAG: radical SAM family heme chaperone HemW [Dehalogenimonas sp.]|uniref:Heme chaperone HemW n=1 Tax=Candidatus Dehalogenimonas loeffleri TaxID=3127115 RepID=A0ABZ2J8L0_9CHLR|nr:radical SAM family heme chaperone HemW [Dehalogenimonas sp.]
MTDISLYIHIPFCARRCAYCSFTSFTGRNRQIPEYIEALAREISLTRRPQRSVATIYFGGGTPSLIQPEDIQRLIAEVNRHYCITEGAEITLEANPGTVNPGYLRNIRLAGVNRLSLGAQSLDDRDLGSLGRTHSQSDIYMAIADARGAGFDNISLDFIYGLSRSRPDGWELMLGRIAELSVEHLSLYGLTVEEGTPLAAAVRSGEAAVPDPDAAAAEYEQATEMLKVAGYQQYEISNWARPGRESRHNLVYWRRGEYLGLGVGAHSLLDNQRLSNTADLDDYLAALSHGWMPCVTEDTINTETALAEAVILGLRLNRGVSADDIASWYNIDLFHRFETEINELIGLGLMDISDGRLRLTSRGRLLGNEVFLRFLP